MPQRKNDRIGYAQENHDNYLCTRQEASPALPEGLQDIRVHQKAEVWAPHCVHFKLGAILWLFFNTNYECQLTAESSTAALHKSTFNYNVP